MQCISMTLACTAHAWQATSKSNGSSWEVADQAEIKGILDLGTWEAVKRKEGELENVLRASLSTNLACVCA
jgi:hypothetical protein